MDAGVLSLPLILLLNLPLPVKRSSPFGRPVPIPTRDVHSRPLALCGGGGGVEKTIKQRKSSTAKCFSAKTFSLASFALIAFLLQATLSRWFHMSPLFLLYEYSASLRLKSRELDRMSHDHGVAGRRKDEEASTSNNGARCFL